MEGQVAAVDAVTHGKPGMHERSVAKAVFDSSSFHAMRQPGAGFPLEAIAASPRRTERACGPFRPPGVCPGRNRLQIGVARRKPDRYTGSVAGPFQYARGAACRPRVSSRAAGGCSAGFSLVEMLIVLVLLLIMIVMFHGFGSRSRQERDKAACRKNLQKAWIALEIFAAEHDGRFPVVTNARTSEEPLALLVPKYTVATDSFICPGGKDSALPDGESFARRTISYAYYMGLRDADAGVPLMSDRQVSLESKPAGAALFSADGDAPGNNHHQYGGNVLFVGGDVQTSKPRAEFSLAPTQQVVLLNPKP